MFENALTIEQIFNTKNFIIYLIIITKAILLIQIIKKIQNL